MDHCFSAPGIYLQQIRGATIVIFITEHYANYFVNYFIVIFSFLIILLELKSTQIPKYVQFIATQDRKAATCWL